MGGWGGGRAARGVLTAEEINKGCLPYGLGEIVGAAGMATVGMGVGEHVCEESEAATHKRYG